MTRTISHKLEMFHNRCMCKILNVFLDSHYLKHQSARGTDTKHITQVVKMRRWGLIGYILRLQPTPLPRVAIRWTTDGWRKGDTPENLEEDSAKKR
ncbi:hypothetical protein ACJMK2_037396 [Sinanodonta woodiana]|uniref:Uncharacterized protein n=1 Tax=Sinanodonta woodiana TaxID=1069815 RepID=A0ABD3WK82_SINWO